VSRHHHPVAGNELLHGPELRLRHPAERQRTATVSSYDEGAGCGFDNLSPDAYAERWVQVDAGAEEVLSWFARELLPLGWSAVEPMPTSGVAAARFSRDADERLGVLLQGVGDWWRETDRAVNWNEGVNAMRVHLAVDGQFSNGSRGVRVG
jgi:hypothetical protein